MSQHILVVHGPNLNLLGQLAGWGERTLAQLDSAIRAHALQYGQEVRIFQSNHEGGLLDRLHEFRSWADAVVLSPAALAHTSYALRDGISAIGKPAVEVHLSELPRPQKWKKVSVIAPVCRAQRVGPEAYLQALEELASMEKKERRAAAPLVKVAKTLGRKVAPGAPRAKAEATKSLGKKVRETSSIEGRLSRSLVREALSRRLAGQTTPAELALWARGHWNQLQQGAPVERGQRELLEETLQRLLLSTVPASALGDEQLVDLMTQLEE